MADYLEIARRALARMNLVPRPAPPAAPLPACPARGRSPGPVIRERVAGMEYARRHGAKSGDAIGRPRRTFDGGEVLRASGLSIDKDRRAKEIGRASCRERV